MAAGIRLEAATLLFVALCTLAAARADALGQEADYTVGPQDVLTITVWNQADLSGKFTVGADGSLSYPLLGSLTVAGLQPRAIEALLRARLGDGYLKNPQVSVAVTQFLSQRIFVLGEVKTPGAVALTGEMTLIEALTRAGGVTESAGGEIVLLRAERGAGTATAPLTAGARGVTEVARISVRDLRSGAYAQNLGLRDGDSIFVPRAELVYVLGQVNNPGAYSLDPGMTVLRAISLAGGVTRVGSTGRVKISRIVDGKKVELKARLDDVVKAGDTITVGTRLI
jgi:polysaccharide export outer membrane protein